MDLSKQFPQKRLPIFLLSYKGQTLTLVKRLSVALTFETRRGTTFLFVKKKNRFAPPIDSLE